jgi:hypothetical protein
VPPHECQKTFKVHQARPLGIHSPHPFLDIVWSGILTESAHNSAKLFRSDETIVVFVENVKCFSVFGNLRSCSITRLSGHVI